MATFTLTLATVDSILFKGEVESVVCPGADGELTVLSHHAPFITTLKQGDIIIRENKETEAQRFEVKRGLLEVGHNRATILV